MPQAWLASIPVVVMATGTQGHPHWGPRHSHLLLDTGAHRPPQKQASPLQAPPPTQATLPLPPKILRL